MFLALIWVLLIPPRHITTQSAQAPRFYTWMGTKRQFLLWLQWIKWIWTTTVSVGMLIMPRNKIQKITNLFTNRNDWWELSKWTLFLYCTYSFYRTNDRNLASIIEKLKYPLIEGPEQALSAVMEGLNDAVDRNSKALSKESLSTKFVRVLIGRNSLAPTFFYRPFLRKLKEALTSKFPEKYTHWEHQNHKLIMSIPGMLFCCSTG